MRQMREIERRSPLPLRRGFRDSVGQDRMESQDGVEFMISVPDDADHSLKQLYSTWRFEKICSALYITPGLFPSDALITLLYGDCCLSIVGPQQVCRCSLFVALHLSPASLSRELLLV